MITIADLRLEDWSKLQKFVGLEHLSGITPTVTDRHIEAFAAMSFPQLRQVSLAYCSNITDHGLALLTNFSSIQGLHLAGTSITDRGMETLATEFPHLKGINVEQCELLTEKGFLSLTNSPTIKSVNVSLEPFSQKDLEKIIATVSNVTWWTISDRNRRLDHDSLRQLGESKGITIQVVDENKSVKGITRVQPQKDGKGPERAGGVGLSL